jgi:hypothetical protein
MADNPISGHTAGANDGLRDGDHILSPSLTNIYEGLHGNGVLNAHDTAFGSSDRNTPTSLPGAVSGSNHQVTIKACSVILDGVPYTIDNGSGGDVTINLTDSTTGGSAFLAGTTTNALTSGKECLFVIVATSLGAKFVQTTPVTTAAGAYSDISGSIADAYLKMSGVSAASNKQTVVLATVRATFNSGAAAANDLKLTLSEINDKRVFVRPSPFYLSPVTTGAVGSTNHLNTHTALEDIHGTGEEGDFGSNGVMWLSYNEDDNLPNLYFSAKDGSNRHTHLLGPNRIKALTASLAFEFDDAQVFTFTGGSAKSLTPTGTFPPGHTVIVSNAGAGVVTFDPSGLNIGLANTEAVMFVYNGTAWVKVIHSSTVTHIASGATGLVQLSDGAGSHTSDAKLFWTAASSTLTVNGKLTVTGLIDPTGLELTPVAANPGGTTANTLWLDNGASNALKHGANTVLNSASSVTDLSDVSAVGSGSIISTAERSKLTAIEAAADVTDATNVNAAITGHAYTAATVSATDKVLIQDTDGGNAVKTVTASSIAALAGDGSSITDADTDTKIDVETSSDADTISMHTAGTERVLIDTNVNLGVDVDLTFEGSTAVGDFETTLTVTNPTADRTITLPDSTGTVALTSDLAAAGITALTGDVTASGSGSVAATIAADAVTYAKMQDVSATDKLLGRDSAGAGIIEEISPADVRTMLNVADGATEYTDAMAQAANAPSILANTILANTNTNEINNIAVKSSKFFAYLSGNQSYSSGSTKITHDTVLWNEGSNFSTSNNEYTAPRDGYYLVACSFYFTSAPSWTMSLIQVDTGSGYAIRLRRNSANGADTHISAVIKLNTGDKVAHYAHAASSGTIGASLNTLTYFQITEML